VHSNLSELLGFLGRVSEELPHLAPEAIHLESPARPLVDAVLHGPVLAKVGIDGRHDINAQGLILFESNWRRYA
jgi:hypothetical protein